MNPTYIAIVESKAPKDGGEVVGVPKDGEEANIGVERKADLGSPGTA